MDINEYTMDMHVRNTLMEARTSAARRAMLGPEPPLFAPLFRALAGKVAALYARWSAPAPTVSEPAPARAWSRSR
jgi:hypothetical protein